MTTWLSVLSTDLSVYVAATVKEQARQSLLNCQAILRAAGATLSDAVMVHTLLMRPEDADDLAEVFDEFFPDVRPPPSGSTR